MKNETHRWVKKSIEETPYPLSKEDHPILIKTDSHCNGGQQQLVGVWSVIFSFKEWPTFLLVS